jgi:MSHA biogenesis protein MshI
MAGGRVGLSLPLWGRRSARAERLVLAWDGGALAFVQARKDGAERHQVQRFGVLRPAAPENSDELTRQLAAAGLRGKAVRAMLRPSQYQMLQVDAPAVPPEELKKAARWQIREMVSLHVDDLTLDVLKVGDDRVRASGSIFVVAAPNAVIREVMGVAAAARCELDLIDIQDLAQRNLQTALARQLGVPDQRAHAAIVMTDDSQALLTICAYGELFYTRRIDLGPGFMRAPWGASGAEGTEALALAGPDEDRAQRLVVEIQRSLDLWDRTWPTLVLDRIFVQAGPRTGELAGWLSRDLGQPVAELDVAARFPGFEGGSEADRQLCWPLLGLLLRGEERQL